jgi:hypothetical protein
MKTAGGDRAGPQKAHPSGAPADGAPASAGAKAAADAPSKPTGPPVVLGCFDSTGKCNLLAWKRASAALRRRSDADLQAQAARLGMPNSAQLGREALARVLMETEELAELTFPAPPTWTQFDAACKKKLGKHLTFEYFPGAAGGASGGAAAATTGGRNGGGAQASPRGVHVKVEMLKSPFSLDLKT